MCDCEDGVAPDRNLRIKRGNPGSNFRSGIFFGAKHQRTVRFDSHRFDSYRGNLADGAAYLAQTKPYQRKVTQMEKDGDQLFNVSSIGSIRRKSLSMLAHRLEDAQGRELKLDDLEIDQSFFVVFPSGTGFTRTSATRIS